MNIWEKKLFELEREQNEIEDSIYRTRQLDMPTQDLEDERSDIIAEISLVKEELNERKEQ